MTQHHNWRKSSYSANANACVEVATAPTMVGVRDSKNVTGPALAFLPQDWSRFLADLRDGKLDA